MLAMQRSKGAVGVWHETYEVNRCEGMHRDMPQFGLVRAVGSLHADGNLEKAAGRLSKCPHTGSEVSEILSLKTDSQGESSIGISSTCPFNEKV